MSLQAVAKATNSTSLVIGEITDREAEMASIDCPIVDGKGLYLISIQHGSPKATGEILAKFVSEDAARELASFFRISGRLEAA